jgi:hypothetical protein
MHAKKGMPQTFLGWTVQRLEETNNLLLHLESELGKDAANQFILIRSAIYYGDNSLPGIDPQLVMGPGSWR